MAPTIWCMGLAIILYTVLATLVTQATAVILCFTSDLGFLWFNVDRLRHRYDRLAGRAVVPRRGRAGKRRPTRVVLLPPLEDIGRTHRHP